MLNAEVAATPKILGKAHDVAVDLGERVIDGVAHTGQSCQIHNAQGLVGHKAAFNRFAVREVDSQVGVVGMFGKPPKAGFFASRIILVFVVIYADDGVATLQQSQY